MFEKRLQEIDARLAELRAKLESDEELDLETVEKEIDELVSEREKIAKRLNVAAAIQTGAYQARTVDSTRRETAVEQRALDPHDTLEYRQAFMRYVTRGERSDILEFRQDEMTLPSDIGAVIPTTIINRIVERMEETGRIWSRVTKTNFRGGVEIPVADAKPVATWVAAGQMADKQKKQVTGKITFSYHKLQVRVSVELVASVVALPIFEQNVADNVAEAMVKAIEQAIISGSGTGQPLGIVNHTNIPTEQIVDVTDEEFGQYQTWPELFRKMPRSYRNGMVLVMNDADFGKYIEGMTDAQGQPVARVNYGLDGSIEERLLGREVIAVEDLLPSIDDAAEGDVVAILFRPSDYMVNSNLQVTYRRYFNEETDEWVHKATMIADGKLADPYGVVLIRKGSGGGGVEG